MVKFGELSLASFYIQREEIELWSWVLSFPGRMRWMTASIDPGSILRAVDLSVAGRMKLIDDLEDAIPGIDLHLA